MVDTVSKEVRSRMMSAIRAKNTKPELAIRRRLHALGFRYVLYSKAFAGKPDMVFPRYRAMIFVHGCYWHGHDCCEVKPAATNKRYWSPKIAGNKERDARNLAAVEAAGWRHLTIWECSFRRKGEEKLEETVAKAAKWIRDGRISAEVC